MTELNSSKEYDKIREPETLTLDQIIAGGPDEQGKAHGIDCANDGVQRYRWPGGVSTITVTRHGGLLISHPARALSCPAEPSA